MGFKKSFELVFSYSSLTDLKINKPNLNLMKKSNLLFEGLPLSKKGFLPFLLTFLFFAALQLDMKGQTTYISGNPPAQPPAKVMFQVPSGNFVSVAVAQDRLRAAITGLKGQLAQYAEGTAPYQAAYLRYVYYSQILENLNHGATVPEAITRALSKILAGTEGPALATPEQAIAEKNAAIQLLRP